jgi:uncharacterized protein
MKIKNLEHLDQKPIFGMIHLSGKSKTKRAFEELRIYQEEGLSGAIVEDYHGSLLDLEIALELSQQFGIIGSRNFALGVNFLEDPCQGIAIAAKFNAQFAQLDTVQTNELDVDFYDDLRSKHPGIAVMGGVRFKYTDPGRNSLEEDLEEARSRCEVIVTTGTGTGIETPVEKLRYFKKRLPGHPVFTGAGVTKENAYEQLTIADGAIVGSYFKPGEDTTKKVDYRKVRTLVTIVESLRD